MLQPFVLLNQQNNRSTCDNTRHKGSARRHPSQLMVSQLAGKVKQTFIESTSLALIRGQYEVKLRHVHDLLEQHASSALSLNRPQDDHVVSISSDIQ
jgi:hypothetical protein